MVSKKKNRLRIERVVLKGGKKAVHQINAGSFVTCAVKRKMFNNVNVCNVNNETQCIDVGAAGWFQTGTEALDESLASKFGA